MRRGTLAAAAARVEHFFLEPAVRDLESDAAIAIDGLAVSETPPPLPVAPRPVIAVIGLSPRCGATVVARALAAELAVRDAGAAAAVVSERRAGAMPLGTPAARRLAAVLADVPRAATVAVGRLCLVEGAHQLALVDAARALAPLVIDAGNAELDGEAGAVADRVVLVSSPNVEPALSAAAAACVRCLGAEPLPVANRARRERAGEPARELELPESRMGAQLALAGRPARGGLGDAIGRLADLCKAAR